MKIIQDFPFNICEKCTECLLDVRDNTLYADNRTVTREITVSCRNEWLCKQIREQLEGCTNAIQPNGQ